MTGMSQKNRREQKSLPRDLPPTVATTARSAPGDWTPSVHRPKRAELRRLR
eukprot:CAMPEP_0185527518 /NCGR_PEP_ID=MMETSP1366-20130426/96295_1 /TAXON_ID=38817 /ORGANISM="Gephyrocapsa oceanica, Strain RCC1303" /LENGTH=50 /DNA_ID=CAMNT_0028139025 /DNA_START=404 /DNA_END=552 /DNA_ORIENTATION=+